MAIVLIVGLPIHRIGLFITLRPWEKLFDWLLWQDRSKNWTLRGNFAPIDKEHQYEIDESMILVGAIPDDINGVFLRNGPNPLFMPPHNRHHWFDGDGHIHGFRLKNGKAYYCNRQTQSAQHKLQVKLGR
jgi:carotenoid cleavage dioxygenase-like enzyme